jgi:hypothetical protein
VSDKEKPERLVCLLHGCLKRNCELCEKDAERDRLKRQVEAHLDLFVRMHDFLISVVNARISNCPDQIYTPQLRCSTADALCADVQEVIEGRKQKGGAG